MAFILVIINTIYLGREEKWYKRKKPQLQIEILACLAVLGNLSKSKLGTCLKKYYYNDISHSVDALTEKKYISLARLNHGRGRPEKYYKINERGLGLLLLDDPIPEKFWRIIIGFCHHGKHTIHSSILEKMFKLFSDRYLKYSYKRAYSLPLDLFNDLQEQLLRSCNSGDGKIKLDQKILEILSLNPRITFKELLKMTIEKSEFILRQTLAEYSPISHRPLIIGKEPSFISGPFYDERSMYSNLLKHKTIIVSHSVSGEDKFELSLLGVMLVFSLVRLNDEGKLRQGLYHKDLSIQEYYERIVHNYKEKLPLIFGKWQVLKSIYGLHTVYNFDIILDKEVRSNELKKPIYEGGNKEFYEAIESLSAKGRKEMVKIQSAGLQGLFNYRAGMIYADPDMTKMQPLIYKILEILSLSSPLDFDPASYIQTMKEATNDEKSDIGLETMLSVSNLYKIETIERAFAELATLYYYFNLQSEFDTVTQQTKYSRRKGIEDTNSLNGSYYPLTGRQIAVSIFCKDAEIKEWFSDWIKDLIYHEHEKEVAMEIVRNEMGLLK
jgi:hypothetical protein